VPHDVHPVGITYREDLFREAGIDLSAARTWPELQQSCLQFERYWQRRGNKTRHAIELFAAKPDVLLMMLLPARHQSRRRFQSHLPGGS